MSQSQKIWFVTGISRGLGRELAKAVLARGDVVIGTTRDGDSGLPSLSHRLHVLPLELPSADQARAAIVTAHALHGRLDVIVNNGVWIAWSDRGKKYLTLLTALASLSFGSSRPGCARASHKSTWNRFCRRRNRGIAVPTPAIPLGNRR